MKSLLYCAAIFATAACGLLPLSVLIGLAWAVGGFSTRLERMTEVEEVYEVEEPVEPPPPAPAPPPVYSGNVRSLAAYRKSRRAA